MFKKFKRIRKGIILIKMRSKNAPQISKNGTGATLRKKEPGTGFEKEKYSHRYDNSIDGMDFSPDTAGKRTVELEESTEDFAQNILCRDKRLQKRESSQKTWRIDGEIPTESKKRPEKE